MNNKSLPLEVIERWLRDNDYDVRAAAMNACQGKDVPLEVIERWLRDNDWRVRAAAMNACQRNGIPLPLIRTIEPPELVYKKCVGGVIVVATIPPDAQVRGAANGKCRTDKAHIVEVIGDFAGENVGISIWDRRTTYYAGDDVVVDDFDYSNEECSRGYHFFCTREQAENYN